MTLPARHPWTLAVDPGTTVVGWALFAPAGDLRSIGVIRPKGSLPFRLGWIAERLQGILFAAGVPHGELDLALERAIVFGHDLERISGTIKVAEARGAILAVAGRYHARAYDYVPSQAKKALTGGGNATKELVADFVARIYRLSERPPLDATDAAAIGHCHLARRGRTVEAGA
jgi:crossover junction endodeoxyribonuclease RuvC